MILKGKWMWRFIDKRKAQLSSGCKCVNVSRISNASIAPPLNSQQVGWLETENIRNSSNIFRSRWFCVHCVHFNPNFENIWHFDIGLVTGSHSYTPLRCLGWKVKFWRWMANIKMNVTFLNEILFWMNGTELVLRICTSYSWPVTILQMIYTAPSISDNSQQSTRKYKILCPHIKSTSPKQHSNIFYSPSTTEISN